MEGHIVCSEPGCTSTFSSTSTLRRHIRIIHQGARPESCSTCSKTFRDKYSLKVHSKVHGEVSGEGEWECEVCSRTFSVRSAYRNHVKVHKDTVENKNEVAEPVPQIPCEPPSSPPSDTPEPSDNCADPPLSLSSAQCFICAKALDCSTFLEHIEEHVRGLIQVCNETAETLGKCQVSLEHAEVALRS
jgi:hypothetical protein